MTREEASNWHKHKAYIVSVEGVAEMSKDHKDKMNEVFDYIDKLKLERCEDLMQIAKLSNKIRMTELDNCKTIEDLQAWEIKHGIITNETN